MYFLRATSPSTISAICGCISGSPPGMDTMGAPHSSTARKHSSGERFCFRTCAGYWILPHPAQARLQRNSGSSISTSGYCFRPWMRCLRTYVATVHIWDTGTAIGLFLEKRSCQISAVSFQLLDLDILLVGETSCCFARLSFVVCLLHTKGRTRTRTLFRFYTTIVA